MNVGTIPRLPYTKRIGKIPILEYHHIGGNAGRWNRSVKQFQDDLLWLYNNDYVSMSLQDFVESRFAVPYGKKPVILHLMTA